MKPRQRYFNSIIGDEYELFRLACPHHDELQGKVAETLIKNLSPEEEVHTVLEIGFGTGITSKKILAANPKITLLGVDNSKNMLQKANTELLEAYTGRYKFDIEDALTYLQKIPRGSITAVISVWTLHNFNENYRNNILQEIHRVLKSDGTFINGDKIAVKDPKLHKNNFLWQLKQFDIFEKIGKAKLKQGWITHYIDDEKEDVILRETAFKEILTTLHFTDYNLIFRKHMDAVIIVRK
jgi:tRNA (cmo5U34)-methyltransferase